MRALLVLCVAFVALARARAEPSECCEQRLMTFANVTLPEASQSMQCRTCYPTEQFVNDTHWVCVTGTVLDARDVGVTRSAARFNESPCALPRKFVMMKRATATVTDW